jgi:hypothetical protein
MIPLETAPPVDHDNYLASGNTNGSEYDTRSPLLLPLPLRRIHFHWCYLKRDNCHDPLGAQSMMAFGATSRFSITGLLSMDALTGHQVVTGRLSTLALVLTLFLIHTIIQRV